MTKQKDVSGVYYPVSSFLKMNRSLNGKHHFKRNGSLPASTLPNIRDPHESLRETGVNTGVSSYLQFKEQGFLKWKKYGVWGEARTEMRKKRIKENDRI